MGNKAASREVYDENFNVFRSNVAQRQLNLSNRKTWKYYQAGDSSLTPFVCLHSTAGTPEQFYKQFNDLVGRGLHLIACQFPPFDTHLELCQGFDDFLSALNVEQVHIFGCGLGGFLAQIYASQYPHRVRSLVLLNSFCNNKPYEAPVAQLQMLPPFLLRSNILDNFPQGELESGIADAVDFMVVQFDTVPRTQLVSRMTLNCTPFELRKPDLPEGRITIMETLDFSSVREELLSDIHEYYPRAKVVHFKTGGDFPFLSRAPEVNMHLMVHFRRVESELGGSDPTLSQPDTNPEEQHQHREEGEGEATATMTTTSTTAAATTSTEESTETTTPIEPQPEIAEPTPSEVTTPTTTEPEPAPTTTTPTTTRCEETDLFPFAMLPDSGPVHAPGQQARERAEAEAEVQVEGQVHVEGQQGQEKPKSEEAEQ